MHVGHVGDNGRRKPPFLCDPKRSACGARRGGGGALYRPAMRNRWQRARESFRQGAMQCVIDGKLTDGVGGVWGSRLGRWRRLQAAQPGRRAHSRPAFLAQSTAAASAPTCACVCVCARVRVCVCVRTTSQRQHHAGTRVGVRGVCVSVRSLRSARPCVRLRHTTHASRHSAPHCSGRRRNRQAARQGKARRRPELERAACDAQLRRQDRVAVGRVMQVGVRRSHCLL